MDKHKDCCQLRMLGPHLEFQQKRLKECVTFMDRLRRQNDQFRQFTVAVEEILDLDPLDPTQHTRASNAHQTVPSRAQTNRTTPDPVMDHLVSLTERLRGEVGRVTQVNSTLHGEIAGVRTTMQEEFARLQENTARSLAEIEARYDMQILDASVRYDQDIAQANASIASLRGQIQWLVNRVTNTQRAATVRAQNAGNDGPSISRRAEAIAASQSGGPSQSGAVSSPDPPERRLSDSSRQDPKL
ncbi:hypothetical protein MMC13_000980 [Lambiella insularis]|nr:hypothetical protein [Lambiella insularis]